jgi:hypothetical protein
MEMSLELKVIAYILIKVCSVLTAKKVFPNNMDLQIAFNVVDLHTFMSRYC